jgi:hypothetical protein
MVLEMPPKALGAIDDQWFRWVIDIGAPGPDCGEGGKYLIVPPGYDVSCPRVASTLLTPKPTMFCGSLAHFWRTKAIRSP